MRMDDKLDRETENELLSIYFDTSEDADFYGARHNKYNPEIHIGCVLEGSKNMEELIENLTCLNATLMHLSEEGWELSQPVEDAMIFTEWKGQGKPPLEDSMFDETGYDLEGNHRDDWNEE